VELHLNSLPMHRDSFLFFLIILWIISGLMRFEGSDLPTRHSWQTCCYEQPFVLVIVLQELR